MYPTKLLLFLILVFIGVVWIAVPVCSGISAKTLIRKIPYCTWSVLYPCLLDTQPLQAAAKLGDFLLGNCIKNYTTTKKKTTYIIEFLCLWLTCITLTVEKNEAFNRFLGIWVRDAAFQWTENRNLTLVYASSKVKNPILHLQNSWGL